MADLLNTNIGPERVQAFDVPLGTSNITGVTTDVTAFLVATDFPGAPVNVPTMLSDPTTFQNTFGDADNFFFDGYYAAQGYWNNAGTGAQAIIVNVGDGTHQVTDVTTVADTSGSLNSTYWTINSGRNKTMYYVWYNVAGVGVDPKPAGLTGIPVALATGATATAVAVATAAALNATSNFTVPTPTSSAMVVTNTAGGAATPAANGTATPAFTITTPTAGANPQATDFIGNASTGTGLRALDTIDTVGLLEVPGLPLSEAYLVDPATIDYAKVIRADFGSTLSTTFSLLAIPKEITSAQNNVQVLAGTVATVSGQTITLTGSPSLAAVTAGQVVMAGGVYVGTITTISGANITLTTVGTLATSTAVTVNVPSAITYKENVVNDPSRLAAWYYNNVEVLSAAADATAGELYVSSPLGHVAGVYARIDANVSIGGVSHSPAGIQYAGIAGIQGLSLSISERLDGGPLRLNFINRITSFPGAGVVIFGGYTADSGTSPIYTASEELIQVMRTLQFLKASLEPGLRSYLWENFSPVTQGRVVQAVIAFMQNNIYLFPAGLPQNQQFNIISVTPTTTELNEGLLRVRVQVRPNSAVRFIELDLEFPLPSA